MNEDKVCLGSLEGMTILYRGDLHDLAQFILRAYDAYDAYDEKSNSVSCKTRPTLHGLARTYGVILDVDPASVEEVIKAHGLSLGAIVDYDEGAAQHAAAPDGASRRR